MLSLSVGLTNSVLTLAICHQPQSALHLLSRKPGASHVPGLNGDPGWVSCGILANRTGLAASADETLGRSNLNFSRLRFRNNPGF
jgi:hypothetical protein